MPLRVLVLLGILFVALPRAAGNASPGALAPDEQQQLETILRMAGIPEGANRLHG
jgi:hypothetical protein